MNCMHRLLSGCFCFAFAMACVVFAGGSCAAEANQLLIGPYAIDAKGNVRVVPPAKMPGRLTGAARHLSDPNKVYVATMETGLYELDMRTLDVNTLIRENGKNDHEIDGYLKKVGAPMPTGWASAPVTHVPGYHAKGLCGGRGLMYLNGKVGVIDDLWKNGSAASAYWLWEKHGRVQNNL